MFSRYFRISQQDGTELKYNPLTQQFLLVDIFGDARVYLTLEEVQKLFNPAPKYIITNSHFGDGVTVEGDTLFWSNEYGWVEPADIVSVFAEAEKQHLNLPISGYWYNIFG